MSPANQDRYFARRFACPVFRASPSLMYPAQNSPPMDTKSQPGMGYFVFDPVRRPSLNPTRAECISCNTGIRLRLTTDALRSPYPIT